MKKIFSLFTSLLMAVSLLGILPAITASAEKEAGFTYEQLEDGTVRITDYDGTAKNLSIPAKLNNKTVSEIGDFAFSWNKKLVSVTIPSGVKFIGYCAFGDCSNINKVTLSNTVETIDKDAFLNTALTSVALPASLRNISPLAFDNCNSLKSLTVNTSNPKFKSVGGIVYNKAGTAPIIAPFGLNTITIANGVTNIPEDTFSCFYNLTSITLPNSLETIENGAFEACERLTSIVIPNKVTTIGNYAFRGAVQLASVTLGNSIEDIGNQAFYICPSLNSVVIPNKVSIIRPYAFGYDQRPTGEEDGDMEIYDLPSFKIYCYPASAGHRYAKNNNLKYQLILPRVTGFKVLATSNTKVKLTCDKQEGADGYIFYQYNPTNKKWTRKAKTTANTYVVSDLKAGTTYKFAAKAYRTIGGVDITSLTYPTVVTSTLPVKVNLSVTAGSKKATLKWSKQAGVTGYLAYYKTSANGKWIGLAKTSGTSATKTGLTSGKTYWFTVRGYRTVGGKNYFGAFTTKSVKVK